MLTIDPTAFLLGYCAEFAITLHNIYGYPIALYLRVTPKDEIADESLAHAFCLHPHNPTLICDVKGWRPLKTLHENIPHEVGSYLRLETSYKKEDVEGSWGLEEEMLEAAETLIKENPLYQTT